MGGKSQQAARGCGLQWKLSATTDTLSLLYFSKVGPDGWKQSCSCWIYSLVTIIRTSSNFQGQIVQSRFSCIQFSNIDPLPMEFR
ncbi:hypothetical protein P8452_66447 [Trifolium repens]|nr:hypothetical protein P8452_66447 [Trifolium repens]